jgi:ParB family chromosome partitioning protein
LTQIPLDDIDETALPRDRTQLDPAALEELKTSIAVNGLRQPIEVFELEGGGHGLISGLRRLTAFRALHALSDGAKYAAIPATICRPADIPDALARMVEENDIRSELSPWEKGHIAVAARDAGYFETLEGAVARLYPHATGAKRSRLHSLALLAEKLDGILTAPEGLSQRQCLRLATALRAGFEGVIFAALQETRATDPAAQWELLKPVLDEAELSLKDPAPDPRPGRPRRVTSPRHGLTIRREMTKDGWILRFTGREATGMMIESVLDEIDRMYGPA